MIKNIKIQYIYLIVVVLLIIAGAFLIKTYQQNIEFKNNIECTDKVQKLVDSQKANEDDMFISVMDVFYSRKYNNCFYEIQKSIKRPQNGLTQEESYFMQYGIDNPISSKNIYYPENCLSLKDKIEMKNCLDQQKEFFENIDEYRGHKK